MTEPKTICDIINHLAQKGFTADFKALQDGFIVFPQKIHLPANSLKVESIHRVEGETDLSDETIVFALFEPKSGIKGTYTVAFGPMTLEADVKMLQELKKNMIF